MIPPRKNGEPYLQNMKTPRGTDEKGGNKPQGAPSRLKGPSVCTEEQLVRPRSSSRNNDLRLFLRRIREGQKAG